MREHSENVHLLLKVDTPLLGIRGVTGYPAPGRAPRARTAPNPSKEHISDTIHFLKKNQRIRHPPVIDKKEYRCVLEAPRPPVPKKLLPAPDRSQKNFVRENVQRAVHMEAKPPTPITVVSCRGERRDLSRFLEGRKLRESESFGQIPKYLMVRKKIWDREETQRQQESQRNAEHQGSMPGYSQVSDAERQALLKGLKDRWMEIHKEFQVLPVLCDTPPKVKRKLHLERQLAALEKDIELLETNPYIFLDMENRK